jgi:prepilin-type N-terminal cleavage/methylation domain-containing protein
MNRAVAKGFTLIELLIVVAIIAILAAIAVPNFLEAQVRAKVSRVKNDLRTVSVGLESYLVDNNIYPYPLYGSPPSNRGFFIESAVELTTPVAYLTSVNMVDTFAVKNRYSWPGSTDKLSYEYGNFGGMVFDLDTRPLAPNERRKKAYYLLSWGPNRLNDYGSWATSSNGRGVLPLISEYFGAGASASTAWNSVYDATNGTISGGDIGRYGGECRGPGN